MIGSCRNKKAVRELAEIIEYEDIREYLESLGWSDSKIEECIKNTKEREEREKQTYY